VPQETRPDRVIGTIEKNKKERLEVSISEYHGRDLISLRVWFRDDKSGEWQPGRQGLALRIELLPQLTNLLQQAQLIAQQQNLLSLPPAAPTQNRTEAQAKTAADQLAALLHGSRKDTGP